MLKKILVTAILSLVVCLFSCAHQGSPSGGPDDKTSPTVLSSYPGTESVNVPKNTHIIITFSEWISTKSDRGVSIFPPVPIKIKVTRNKLEIIPTQSLADSTTYHITINTLLQDLHNNPILFPLSLTFSTGSTLDSGSLRGCVIDPSKKAIQPKIALFKKDIARSDTMFSTTPDYLIQTDSAGTFDLTHIKKGLFYVIGFLDANSDNRIQPVTEQVFAPAESLISVSANTKQILLFPAVYDTTKPKLKSVKASTSTIITGLWNVPFDQRNGYTITRYDVERIDSLHTKIQGTIIPLPDKHQFTFLLKSPLQIAPYHLIYTIKRFDNKNYTDTVTFNGITTPDTTRAVLQSWFPPAGSSMPINPDIKLIWSKPVTITSPLSLIDTLGDTVMARVQGGYSDTTILIINRHLHPGSTYRSVILSKMGNDLSGNKLKQRDTTDTTAILTFRTIDPDSLAVSLQGSAPCLEKSNHRKWMFIPFSKGSPSITSDHSGLFRFDSIPAGKGTISYFEDFNENNKPDPGRILPWIAPEPYISSQDTVEARARWEVEGVELKVCEPCKKRALPASKDTLNKKR